SKDAAQPTQSRYSKLGFNSTVGTSRPSAQARRSELGRPEGLDWLLICCSALAGGPESFPSPIKSRRISLIKSTCPISTGHSSTHAWHIVQAQSVSSRIVVCTSLPPRDIRPRKSITTALGERGLPLAVAGHASLPRPHSLQESN